MAPPRTEGQRKISAFFAPKPSSASGGQSDSAAKEPPAKRQRLSAPAATSQQQQQQQHQPPSQPAVAAPRTVTPAPGRDAAALAAKARRKLVTGQTGDQLVYDAAATATQAPSAAVGTSAAEGGGVPIPTPGKGSKLTPLEQQVVALKQANPGVVLVIEVGYKFRLFGEDATIAAQLCNIFAYPDHSFLTCGFPVYRLPVYVRRLVNAGHKVGVVRQTETAAIKSQGANKSAPFERKLTALYTAATLDAGQRADKAGEEGSLEEFAELAGGMAGAPRYILYVAEEQPFDADIVAGRGSRALGQRAAPEVVDLADDSEEEEQGRGRGAAQAQGTKQGTAGASTATKAGHRQSALPNVALLLVEPSTGEVQLGMATCGEGRDAATDHLPSLEGALLMTSPTEVLLAEPVSLASMRLLRTYAASSPGTRMEVSPVFARYLSAEDEGRLRELYQGREGQYKEVLQLPPACLRVLCAAQKHLETFGLDACLRPRGEQGSEPPAGAGPGPQASSRGLSHQQEGQPSSPALTPVQVQAAGFQPLAGQAHMVLGANALRQLEVLTTSDGSKFQGSLLHLLDRTYTAGGSRQLREWVTKPLTSATAIIARLDAVEELAGVTATHRGAGAGPIARLPDTLRRLPDLERGLTRALHRTAPPSEFVATLLALGKVPPNLGLSHDTNGQVVGIEPEQVASPLLGSLLRAAAAADVQQACSELLGALDLGAARKNCTADMLADSERFADVHERKADVAAALTHLQSLLPDIAKQLGVRSVEYVSVLNQGDYLVEVPVEAQRRVPSDWTKVSGTKKVSRYHPPAVREGLVQLEVAKERLAATAVEAYSRFLGEFAQHYPACKAAASALSQLDALLALAAVARTPGYCRPAVSPSPPPGAAQQGGPPQHLVIRGGRHPMLEAQRAAMPLAASSSAAGGSAVAGAVVPNDIELRADGTRAAIITGPNMGGKSCLIRLAALTVIMAQIGSFVPADSVRMSVFDAVYTRMGASDNLQLGRSTFLEELSDTSAILAHATPRSLVILDELGRGTATHDGVAIAGATLDHLVHSLRCLTLFVTHFPQVIQACQGDSGTGLVHTFHMSYLKEDVCEEEVEEAEIQPKEPQPLSNGAAAVPQGNAETDDDDVVMISDSQEAPQPSLLTISPKATKQGVEGGVSTAGTAVAAVGVTAVTPTHTEQPVSGEGTSSEGQATCKGVVVPRLTFLYKLAPGAADASFGLNVAQMACLPAAVVQRAARKAAALQEEMGARQALAQAARVVAAISRCVKEGFPEEDVQELLLLQQQQQQQHSGQA